MLSQHCEGHYDSGKLSRVSKTVHGEVRTQRGPALCKTVKLKRETCRTPLFLFPHFWIAVILLPLTLLPYQSRKISHENMRKGTHCQGIKRTKPGSSLGIFQPMCYTYLGDSVFSSVERGIQTR